MATTGFRLTVYTEAQAVLEETVSSLIAPGTEGYLGVLRNHAPLVTQLMPGKLTVKDLSGQEMLYAVSGGFLEVSNNQATVLADAIEPLAEIDLSRAQMAEERARKRLAVPEEGIDIDRAEAALKRSLNRQRLGKKR